jgi:hypothetical protein
MLLVGSTISENIKLIMFDLKQHLQKVPLLGQKEAEGRGGGQASCST